MAYFTLSALSPIKVLTASYMNDLNENLRIISAHAHSPSLGEGASIVGSTSAACGFVYRQEAQSFLAASVANGGSGISTNNYFGVEFVKDSPGTAASARYPVALHKGTYTLWIFIDDQQAANASARVLLNGASIASLATRGSACFNAVCVITGITVANSASMEFEVDSNATGGAFYFGAWKLKRTGS